MISNTNAPVNKFSDDLWQQLESKVTEIKNNSNTPQIAAFDADGTLWGADVGTIVFEHQCRSGMYSHLPEDPAVSFKKLVEEGNHSKLYRFHATIMGNLELEAVQKSVVDAYENFGPIPVFEDVKKFMELLVSKDFQVYIVSASSYWTLLQPARLLPVPPENVIGVRNHIEGTKLSNKLIEPVSAGPGKVDALLEKTEGKRAQICVGNTMNDLPLLESATEMRLAIHSETEGHQNFESEQKLWATARERGWFHHGF